MQLCDPANPGSNAQDVCCQHATHFETGYLDSENNLTLLPIYKPNFPSTTGNDANQILATSHNWCDCNVNVDAVSGTPPSCTCTGGGTTPVDYLYMDNMICADACGCDINWGGGDDGCYLHEYGGDGYGVTSTGDCNYYSWNTAYSSGDSCTNYDSLLDFQCYTPVKITHEGDGNNYNANESVCCVSNAVNYVKFRNDNDQYWEDIIPFCNPEDQSGVNAGLCNKVTSLVYNSDSGPYGNYDWADAEPWVFKHIDLGTNAFGGTGLSGADWSWLCDQAANGATIKGCGGYGPNPFSAGADPLQCTCPNDNCDTFETACIGSEFQPCNRESFSTYCDTETMNPGGTGEWGVNEATQCDGSTPCQCGTLDECGVCQTSTSGGFDDVDPCCGAESDDCQICGGTSQRNITINRYYWSAGSSVIYWDDSDVGYGDNICRSGAFCDWNVGGGHPCEDFWADFGDYYCDVSCGGSLQSFCYCDCGTGDDHSGAATPTPLSCYDTQGDTLDQVLVPACQSEAGVVESCGDVVWPSTSPAGRWTDDPTLLYDAGCRDPDACNAFAGNEKDCAGITQWDGAGLDEGDIGDTGCCVYRAIYCVGNGYLYGPGPTSDQAGNNGYCDVNEDGVPQSIDACPMCDCDNTSCGPEGWNSEGTGYPCDCPDECNPNNATASLIGYGEHGQFNGGTDGDWLQVQTEWLINTNNCPASTQCYFYVGASGTEIIPEMTDLYLYELYGCNDPAALNYDIDGPLYMDPATDLSDPSYAINQAPVTLCQYCPGGSDGYDGELMGNITAESMGCPAGYEFYFDTHFVGYNISSAADVTDSSWSSPNPNFDLRLQNGLTIDDNFESSILQNSSGDYTAGACYCRTDLDFLKEMTERISGWQTTFPYDPWESALRMNQTWGRQVWDSYGRLQEFSSGGKECLESLETCKENLLEFGKEGATFSTIPDSIGDLSHLQYLDLSKNYITGTIPWQIEGVKETIQYLDFSYNNLNEPFNEIEGSGHGIYLGSNYYGICAIAHPDYLGYPGHYSNNWLRIMGNKICPNTADQASGQVSYPECLAPPAGYNWGSSDIYVDWCEWIYHNLGYADIPCYSTYNDEAQNLYNLESGELICDLVGCRDPQATNYWAEASQDCANCCVYDRFLHFPWGPIGGEIYASPYVPEIGEPGGHMSLYQMIQALHADIYGFQYNARGELDVTPNTVTLSNISMNDPGCTQTDTSNGWGTWLTIYQINTCDYNYSNEPESTNLSDWYESDGIINHWDGLWLRDAGYEPLLEEEPLTGYCMTPDAGGDMVTCSGDARVLEFINRVEMEAYYSGDPSGTRDYWWSFFPPGGQNISFQGIVYLEDYDLDQSGNLGLGDQQLWERLGRFDISSLIEDGFPGMAYPEFEPEDVELWEQAPSMVSMSYSQKFISEAQAGFTLYPEENTPGVLTRNGQWYCSDGGNSEVCYSDIYACGRAPNWVEECAPCGTDGECVPITLDTAAEGHDKISKTKEIAVPYFSNNNSATLLGSDIYTGSLANSNTASYYSIINGSPDLAGSSIQLHVSWGHYAGSGSNTDNDDIIGVSQTVYGQYASLLLDDLAIDTGFFITSGSDVGTLGGRDDWIYVLNFKRNNFEDQLQAGNWTLHLSGSNGAAGGKIIHLTDSSKALSGPTIQSAAGRRYDIVSGSNGNVVVGASNNNRYGFFYPDFGIMVFGTKIASELSSGSMGNGPFSPDTASFNSQKYGNDQLLPYTGSDYDGRNALRFINCMKNVDIKGTHENSYIPDVFIPTGSGIEISKGTTYVTGSGTSFQSDLTGYEIVKIQSGSVAGGSSSIHAIASVTNDTEFILSDTWTGEDYTGSIVYKSSPIFTMKLYGEKEATEVIYICRIPGDSFNFTNNFSIISGSGRQMYSPDTGVLGSFNTGDTSAAFTGSAGEPSSPVSGSEPIETQTVIEDNTVFIWPGSNVSTMHGNPHTFITGVELFDQHGECLAIARLSSPQKKAFDRESVIKVKLIF